RLIFCGLASSLNASARPRIASGGASGRESNMEPRELRTGQWLGGSKEALGSLLDTSGKANYPNLAAAELGRTRRRIPARTDLSIVAPDGPQKTWSLADRRERGRRDKCNGWLGRPAQGTGRKSGPCHRASTICGARFRTLE